MVDAAHDDLEAFFDDIMRVESGSSESGTRFRFGDAFEIRNFPTEHIAVCQSACLRHRSDEDVSCAGFMFKFHYSDPSTCYLLHTLAEKEVSGNPNYSWESGARRAVSKFMLDDTKTTNGRPRFGGDREVARSDDYESMDACKMFAFSTLMESEDVLMAVMFDTEINRCYVLSAYDWKVEGGARDKYEWATVRDPRALTFTKVSAWGR